MKFFSDIRLLLLGIWLGASCFFIAVAQSAFSVLPAREMAGLIVNRTLAILEYAGIGIAVLLILMSLVGTSRVSKWWLWTERILLMVVAAACAVGQFLIGFWLSSSRAQMGKPIDEVAANDPLRIQFNNLHEYSVWVLFVGMAAAVLVFFIISNRKFVTVKDTKSDVYDFSQEFKV
ncbi:MAG: DUF4149 domain-containing protein [Acidobacteriota bacterium]